MSATNSSHGKHMPEATRTFQRRLDTIALDTIAKVVHDTGRRNTILYGIPWSTVDWHDLSGDQRSFCREIAREVVAIIKIEGVHHRSKR